MRLVVDTNVFVSAALKHSSWPASIVRWIGRNSTLLKSEATEAELFMVLERPRIATRMTRSFVENLRALFADAELIAIGERVAACRDPKDDKFLELAVNGNAAAVVTGDADLLALGQFRGVHILDPATFGRSQLI
jgi:putative PIN family toxin of toxin-antitoxin system